MRAGVVGPKAITCIYNVFLLVPPNTYFPSIHLGFAGVGNRQNCANVRLTGLHNVAVPDSNVLNNKSCKYAIAGGASAHRKRAEAQVRAGVGHQRFAGHVPRRR